jgi:molybdopterin/thiamine biosynthesis adenylyltransferase
VRYVEENWPIPTLQNTTETKGACLYCINPEGKPEDLVYTKCIIQGTLKATEFVMP